MSTRSSSNTTTSATTQTSTPTSTPTKHPLPNQPASSPTPVLATTQAMLSDDNTAHPQGLPAPAPSGVVRSLTSTDVLSVNNLMHDGTQRPSTSSRPSAPARLTEKIEHTRIAATADPFYLALGDQVRVSTAWIRDGRANVLVTKADADSVAEGLAAHAADPTAVDPPPMPDRVRCTVIGTINNDQAYFRADGNYKGENPALAWHKSFAQTTLSFGLGCPPSAYPNLVTDFHAAIATFESILPSTVNLKSGQYVQGFPSKHLRLRHSVFAPRPEENRDSDDRSTIGDDPNIPAEFTIFQWPAYSPEAADALAAIVHSHVARPLPAYDLRGDLIPPTQYATALRGATVLLSFNIAHYSISEKRSNGSEAVKQQICLDVDYIRVLIPPPRTSPAKRSAIHLTDPHSHAAKKLRDY